MHGLGEFTLTADDWIVGSDFLGLPRVDPCDEAAVASAKPQVTTIPEEWRRLSRS